MPPKIISIEGNIGSGKSTLKKMIESSKAFTSAFKCPVFFVDEPVDEWENIKDLDGCNIIENFYKNQGKYAFPFQMMAYISRLKCIKNVIEHNKDKDCIIICERSIWSDRHIFCKMLYDQGDINEIEYKIYNTWFDEFSTNYTIDGIIYVTTEPPLCIDRISKRNRSGENISLEYLENCHKYHTNWLGNYSQNVKLNIPADFEKNIKYKIYAFIDNFFSH